MQLVIKRRKDKFCVTEVCESNNFTGIPLKDQA